jgi:hypothetical protein
MVKVRSKKRTQSKQQKALLQKRGFLWLGITAALLVGAIAGIFWMISSFGNVTDRQTPRAAIIDQLYSTYPNSDLTTKLTQELERFGFQVDLYQGDSVTIDLYRNLPQYGYGVIVIRSHSGVMIQRLYDSTNIGTYLFTNEPYGGLKYPKEQLNDEIARAMTENDQPSFFSIGPKFITNSMKGRLKNTVVIIDGCSALYYDDLAKSFVAKGASAYLAWDKSVRLDYADDTTWSLIKNLCSEGVTIDKAVNRTMAEKGPDPESQAILKYYPGDIGNKSLGELTKMK